MVLVLSAAFYLQSVIAWKWDLEMDDTLEQARPEFEVGLSLS